MEKVWEELKKIEAQAEKIRSDAQNKAKEITSLSQQQSEKLAADTKTYAQEEAQKLYKSKIEEANRKSEGQLKANGETAERLKAQAEKRMEKASAKIVDAVLGENTS